MGFNSGFKGLIKHTTYIDIRFVPRNKKADHKGAEQRMLPPGSAALLPEQVRPHNTHITGCHFVSQHSN